MILAIKLIIWPKVLYIVTMFTFHFNPLCLGLVVLYHVTFYLMLEDLQIGRQFNINI